MDKAEAANLFRGNSLKLISKFSHKKNAISFDTVAAEKIGITF